MQEYGPLVPGGIERLLQFGDARHHAEAPLGIRMGEGIGRHARRRRLRFQRPRRTPGCEFQNRFGGFGGKVLGEREQPVFVRLSDIVEPF